jgi:CDP-diglyceride synthetase
VDERDDDRTKDRSSSEPVTERVRIVGAEQASVLAGEPPADEADEDNPTGREQHYLGFVHGSSAPPPPPPPPPPPTGDGGTLAAVPPEMPHWADPPTGQVPAVIDRRADESEEEAAWSAFTDSGPVWREQEHEWEDTGGYEPAMLADDETRVGALEEAPAEERRPWEFDDLTSGPTEVVRSDREGRGAVSGGDDVSTADVDTAEQEIVGHSSVPPGGDEAPGEVHRETSLTEGAGAGWRGEDAGGTGESTGHVPAGPPTGVGVAVAPPAAGATAPRSLETTPPTTTFTANGDPDTLAPSAPSSPAASRDTATVGVEGEALSGTAPVVAARQRRQRQVQAAGPRGRQSERPARRNIPVAIATGVGFAVVGLACFAAGALATLVLATVVVTLAAAEIYASLRRVGMRPATLLGLVATVAVMVTAYSKGVAALPLVLILVVVTSMLWYLVGAERTSPVEGITATVLGFAWVGLTGAFAALTLAPSIYPHRHGVAFVVGAVVATVGSDVGALAVGSWLGRHQLAPHVSPNKTWEGWIGGAIVAIGLSVAITGHVHPWTVSKAAILGAVVAVVAPLGDLCESMVKRDLGLKDMGSLLPGHGGVLDRIDGLLFVLPATYYLVRVLNLG